MHPTKDSGFYLSTDSPCISVPLDLFKSGQLLRIQPGCQGALIIQKQFYADFAGPGAAVGGSFDVDCLSVYVIGEVKFDVPVTYSQRQQAFQTRMEYSKRLQSIAVIPSALDRAMTILDQLFVGLDTDAISEIPSALIGQLAGVLTKTVNIIRQQRLLNSTEKLNIH